MPRLIVILLLLSTGFISCGTRITNPISTPSTIIDLTYSFDAHTIYWPNNLQFLDDLATLAYKEAKNAFTLPGIGKLVLSHRKARIGRNPQTGEPIKIPAKKVVKFRVAKAAKDSILGAKK